ncbi:MAG: 3-phosphoshikimate 1-carboxyvinyltransferase [Deltaproteobacteria bacterium]|jgi:3-phosphoshikimate 1-carboxyvinyltransferase|nr:3-phosphoshikimate 1-carboxyvinyltransferase [Deltaproteobacteria bacterium]MBW2478624.1 3-phosphoshikimate 1-carboxyvinyltransferase [Deltaproteobacteria bacterium]
MIEIKSNNMKPRCDITVPGSKSFTHRMLIASALSNGRCLIDNALLSEDTLLTLKALRQMGIRIEETSDHQLAVYGGSGKFEPSPEPLYLGNSGTSIRLLTAICALGKNPYTLMGNERMAERPIQALIDALRQIGVKARSTNDNGCPPVEVNGRHLSGSTVSINCRTSSQYLTGLLLMAPRTERGLKIRVTDGPVSRPYVDMTIQVMAAFGIEIDRQGYQDFQVAGRQTYRSGIYTVEADASQAGYFWAAAAICHKTVKVNGVRQESCQGDIKFSKVLESMGCAVKNEPDGITVIGGDRLQALEVDMGDMPDMVPTLAAVAAFAQGTTVITNVSHLKAKESDRLSAVANELKKMGITAHCTADELTVEGGQPRGADIETYGDHRIAMSFAVAGLAASGMVIKDAHCVEKSFPNFWEVFEGMYTEG